MKRGKKHKGEEHSKGVMFGGKRVCGKSTELIKESHLLRVPIISPSFARARYLEEMANEVGLEIPRVIAASEIGRVHIEVPGVLVDDIEDVLKAIVGRNIYRASTSMKFKEMKVIEVKDKSKSKYTLLDKVRYKLISRKVRRIYNDKL